MSSSFTNSTTGTFTVTHAKHLASKVAADLKRIQRFYNEPSDASIAQYESELIEFLKAGYLEEVVYGFKKDGKWIVPTVRYKAKDLTNMMYADDDPGKILPNANISGASFSSFMSYKWEYHMLDDAEKNKFKASLPFQRTTGTLPTYSGYMSQDKSYYSGSRGLDRSSLKNF